MQKIHGDTYTYENTNYVSAKTSLLIGCRKHGQFEQVPNYHLSGNGCPECGQETGGRDGLIHFVDNESWANSLASFILFMSANIRKSELPKIYKKGKIWKP